MRAILLGGLLTTLAGAAGWPTDPRFTRVTEIHAVADGIALVVMLDGKVVHEDYRADTGPGHAAELACGTKSFAGVLALCVEEDGLLSLDERVSDILEEWRDDARREITIRQLLTLTSGIPGGQIGQPPSYAEAIQADAVAQPGELFSYGPQPFQVFGEVLRLRLGATQECVAGYLDRRILYPLRIKPAGWKRDEAGHPYLSNGARLTARDWARFGEMIRRDGQNVLPPGKLAQLFVGTTTNPGYGVTWWLPAQGPVGAVISRDVIDDTLPRDIRLAAGAGGQCLVVIPSLKLVAVRLAPARLHEGSFDERAWLRELVVAARAEPGKI
jgi:CubicO group peptidase (beta-lactamase class C family)